MAEQLSTLVARVIHLLDLDGKVRGFEVEPIGPVALEIVARAAYLRALDCHPWVDGSVPAADARARQAALHQIIDLVRSAGELVFTIEQMREPPNFGRGFEYRAGWCAAIESMKALEPFEKLRDQLRDMRPYLQALMEQVRQERAMFARTAGGAEKNRGGRNE